MKKYKILLIVRHPVGGIRTFFKYFYRNYDPEKYNFTLISPDTPETQVLLSDICKLDVTYLPTNNWISHKEFFLIVTNIIKNNKFDLIHSHGFSAGVCSVFGSLLRSVPHILSCHDVFTEKQFVGFKGFVKKILLGIILAMINKIHCVSYDARNNLLDYLPALKIFKNKVVVILNGIEAEHFFKAEQRDIRNEFGFSQDDFLIGFLGRFMSQKGFFYLIEALEEINKKDILKRPVVLCFSPEDGYIREEKENIKNRKLMESVLFLPYVADVASTLKGLDVVVMPSLWEACGLLAMETMAAGVPLIGTNCIGLREVLKDTPATVVTARNGIALAIALLKEMKEPSTISAKEFSKVAVTQFDVKRRAIELENLMLKYLEK